MTRPAAPAQRGSRTLMIGVIAIAVVISILAVGVAVQYWRTHSEVTVDNPGAAEPAVITGPGTDGKGVTVGKEGARSHIEVYLDYRCSHCKEFEDQNGKTLNELVDSGAAKLTYYPMTFVSNDSPRLANAFACAAAAGKPRSYNDALYADFVKAWTTDQLIDLGRKLGIGDDNFEQCVRQDKYAQWLQSVGKAAEARGVQGTPTVFVNGTQLSEDQLTPEAIRTAAGVS